MNKNYSLEAKKTDNQTTLKPFKPKFTQPGEKNMHDSRFLPVVSIL